MTIPFLSGLSDKKKDLTTLIAGYCGITVLYTCLMFICGWYTSHIGYLISPVIIVLLFSVPLAFSEKLKKHPNGYLTTVFIFNMLLIYKWVYLNQQSAVRIR